MDVGISGSRVESFVLLVTGNVLSSLTPMPPYLVYAFFFLLLPSLHLYSLPIPRNTIFGYVSSALKNRAAT